jgi:hypothetical protein
MFTPLWLEPSSSLQKRLSHWGYRRPIWSIGTSAGNQTHQTIPSIIPTSTFGKSVNLLNARIRVRMRGALPIVAEPITTDRVALQTLTVTGLTYPRCHGCCVRPCATIC